MCRVRRRTGPKGRAAMRMQRTRRIQRQALLVWLRLALLVLQVRQMARKLVCLRQPWPLARRLAVMHLTPRA